VLLLCAAVSGLPPGNGIFVVGDRRPKTCLILLRHKFR
jgi:hypothetical protein